MKAQLQNIEYLFPGFIFNFTQGIDIPLDEVRIFLAIREAAASRLFSHAPWLSTYIKDAITAYGAGIKIDIDSIQEQAERALETGELDINNPEFMLEWMVHNTHWDYSKWSKLSKIIVEI